MSQFTLTIICCFLFLPQQSPPQKSGSLSVFPVPKEWSKYQSPELACDPSKISLQIDKGPVTRWPQGNRLEIKNLALDKVHLIVARCAGKPLQAAKFRFSEFASAHLCTTYDAYDGIDLWDYTKHGWGCSK